MERRLLHFTAACLNQEMRIKLRGNGKQYTGILHALDPTSFSIIVHNFAGADERAEFKILQLSQLEYFAVANSKLT